MAALPGVSALLVAGLAVVTNVATADPLPHWLRWLHPVGRSWALVCVLAVLTAVLAVAAARAATVDDRSTTGGARAHAQVIHRASGGNVTGPAHAPHGTLVQAPGGTVHIHPPTPSSQQAPPPRPPLGRLLEQVLADARAGLEFEVHPAIQVQAPQQGVAAQDPLPVYVPRAQDEELAGHLQDAISEQARRMVVLVGESSTGKTRACWQALHQLPARPGGWRIWHPITPADLVDGLTPGAGSRLASGTVVWLNELQRYLLPTDRAAGEAAAAALLRLLHPSDGDEEEAGGQGAVLVLGTIWADPYWATLTATPAGGGPDPFAHVRQLAQQARVIRIPDTFTAEPEVIEAAAAADPRWRVALAEDRDRPVQFLAGAAYLLQRYQDATATRKAVLRAACDARRVGAPQRLPLGLLVEAAPGYLSPADHDRLLPQLRDTTAWVPAALDDGDDALTRGARGVTAPLHQTATPEGSAVYELADYLEQHLRAERAATQPCDSLWTALSRHFRSAGSLTALGSAAEIRGRFRIAADLYRRAFAAGSPAAGGALSRLQRHAGDYSQAEETALQAAAGGYTSALRELALLVESNENPHDAQRLALEAAAAGDTWGLVDLARLRKEVGHYESAEHVAEQAAEAGNSEGFVVLAEIREQAGDHETAAYLMKQAADAGNSRALRLQAATLLQAGDVEGASQIRGRVAAAGGAEALMDVAEEVLRNWDQATPEQLARWLDHQETRRPLGPLRYDWGGEEPQTVEQTILQSVARGELGALSALAQLREKAGDSIGAENTRRFGITADGRPEVGL